MAKTKRCVGHLVRRYRTEAGWTIPELAINSGLSPDTIRSIEVLRRRDPSWSAIQAIASALGLSTEDFRTDTDGWV